MRANLKSLELIVCTLNSLSGESSGVALTLIGNISVSPHCLLLDYLITFQPFPIIFPGPKSFSMPQHKRPRLRGPRRKIVINFWIAQFVNSRGNEYFSEIDEEYLTDRFNLTGLSNEVQYYQYALELITDVLDLECDDDLRDQIEKSARHLYGLIHARWIITNRGLSKMVSFVRAPRDPRSKFPSLARPTTDHGPQKLEKYKKAEFGRCPRVLCDHQPLLPVGLHDMPNSGCVKLYCPKCEDLYNPKSSRHASIDGAYFGTSFPTMFFQAYPHYLPTKNSRRFEPRVFGFRLHAMAALQRWQDGKREEMLARLEREDVDPMFAESEEFEEDDGSSGV